MEISGAPLTAVWDRLTSRTGNRAPRDVVRAFASLGGHDADAVYCTSFSEATRNVWWVLAVSGPVLIRIRAAGPPVWNADDEASATSATEMDAFAAPITSCVTAVSVTRSWSTSMPKARFSDEEPISPWVVDWAIQVNGENWPLPHPASQNNLDQYARAEEVAQAILRRLAKS